MNFTVIGHSCLFIETAAGNIVVDPWLFGSCYWRSWWHYPPSAEPTPEVLSPDIVYLTHHHFDHFHYPSMRRIAKSAKVLVPGFGVDVMPGEVRGLGFDDVEELPHGQTRDLGSGVTVSSWQYGFDDTAFVVTDASGDGDPVTLIDINDCKIRGAALRRLRREVGPVTFMLKSHSFAQSYPHSYTADDPTDLERITEDTYIADFASAAAELDATYAVPFGSMVAFLHPDGQHVNDHLVTPGRVAERFGELGGPAGTEVVTMAPGDSWSASGGFDRSDVDWYTDRPRHLAELTAQVQPKIDAQIEAEAAVRLNWERFESYFASFVSGLALPARRIAMKRPVAFLVESSEQPYWIIDVRGGSVYRSATPPADLASVITVSEAVLAEAIESKIVHFIQGTMRSSTHLWTGGLASDLAFWGLLGIWELGYLPARNMRPRTLAAAWRRRREFLDFAPLLAGEKGFDKVTANFVPATEPTA